MGSFPITVFGDVGQVFNPERYYAEGGRPQGDNPGHPSRISSWSDVGQLFFPFLLMVVAIWALEHRRIKVGGSASAGIKA
jgi:hypothetical protein